MNATISTLMNHATVRKYSNKEISEAHLNTILEAGCRASTTGNMQLYSIIVSRSAEVKEALSPCHFNQPMVKQAPVVLTFCADFNRFKMWCKQRMAEPGYDNFLSFFTAAIDALLAAQNVCIAAESLGMGICYLGTTTYMAHKIVDILNLPENVVPITTLTLGYPEGEVQPTDRLPLAGIVHYETYKPYTPNDINQLYAGKESLESSLKFVTENNKQTLAQVFTDIRYKKNDNETFSKLFLEVIKAQNFHLPAQ